jgi:4-methylaminobutanoate oxidase (formaldehyde-forming)
VEAGKGFELKHCGYHALNSLRIEKAYRDWSHDIGPDDTPLDAGLAFTCAWNKPGGFIGMQALLQAKNLVPQRRLLQFLLEDPAPMLYHNEPIMNQGRQVGFITSGMYGHTLGGAVGLGYVRNEGGVTEEYVRDARFEVLIGNQKVRARASLKPLYDPTSARIRN